jgi:hypothetical protein
LAALPSLIRAQKSAIFQNFQQQNETKAIKMMTKADMEELERPVVLVPEIFEENYKPDSEVYSLMCVF